MGLRDVVIVEIFLDKLEVFLHRNIHRILHVSMFKVKEEHIQNEHV